jgi:hypothetical protein
VFVTTTQVYRGDDADKVAKFQQGKIRGTVQDSVTHFHGDGEISFANPNSKVTMLDISQAGPWLLGIDWGHLPLWNSVYERDKETKTHYQVEANTGVACVLPAWRIMDVLNLEVLVKERNQHDREVTKRIATEGAATFGVAQ